MREFFIFVIRECFGQKEQSYLKRNIEHIILSYLQLKDEIIILLLLIFKSLSYPFLFKELPQPFSESWTYPPREMLFCF